VTTTSRAAAAGLALSLAACGRDPEAPRRGDGAAVRAEHPSAADAAREEARRLGVPVSFENDLGMRFALVPAAREVLGSEPSSSPPSSRADETPHEVSLFVAYYLQAEETTAAQWAAFSGEPAAGGPPDAPATGVTHDEAVAFARWLSARDPAWDYRLPTEAEWEHGARAGRPGDAAGAAEANAFGLAGVHDGPWEWTADWFGPYPTWFTTNPKGPPSGAERVLRGGTWSASDPPARAAARERRPPGARHPRVGVRLLAEVGYGEGARGSCAVAFRTYAFDASLGRPEPGTPEEPGYRVRVVSVFDRLSSRQEGRPLPWRRLHGESSPLETTMVPGRYYAQAERDLPGGGVERGPEMKVQLNPGERVEVLLPVPRPARLLQEPQ
jgi:formylglycine-generating enzyme required for sulfatase activity